MSQTSQIKFIALMEDLKNMHLLVSTFLIMSLSQLRIFGTAIIMKSHKCVGSDSSSGDVLVPSPFLRKFRQRHVQLVKEKPSDVYIYM